jgi:hypothetical protein
VGQLWLSENFSYQDGPLKDVSGGDWEVLTGETDDDSGALYVNNGRADIRGTRTEDVMYKFLNSPLPIQSSSIIYGSARVQVTEEQYGVQSYFLNLTNGTFNHACKIAIKQVGDDSFKIGIVRRNSSSGDDVFSRSYPFGSLHVIVFAYHVDSRRCELWINPDSSSSEYLVFNYAIGTQEPQYVLLRQSSGVERVILDNLKIGGSYASVHSSGSPVRIDRVSLSPVPAADGDQEITIQGSGFTEGATVDLYDMDHGPHGPFTKSTSYVSANELTISANVTYTESNWTAKVENPNGDSSEEFPFEVEIFAVVNDRVRSITDDLNIRFAADIDDAGNIVGSADQGDLGTVLAGPTTGDGYVWYRIQWDNGVTGYSVVDYLENSDGPPIAPTYLEAQAFSARAELGWSTSAVDEDGYYVERRQDAGSWSCIATVGPVNGAAAFYTDDSVSVDTAYSYRVQAFNEHGVSGYSNEVSLITPAGLPGNFTVSNSAPVWNFTISGPSVKLTWTESTDAGAYAVYRDGAVVRAGLSGTSYVDDDAELQANTEYDYFVRASNAEGTTDSNTISVLMGSEVVLNPVITSVSGNPVPAVDGSQPFTIYGSDFHPDCAVHLRDLRTGEFFPNREVVTHAMDQLDLSVNFTSAPATWSVEVVNPDGASTGRYEFEVGQTVVPDQTIDQLEISGPDTAAANTSTPFTAILHYRDGSSVNVSYSCEWRVLVDKGIGVGFSANELKINAVNEPATIEIDAVFSSDNGSVVSSSLLVAVEPGLHVTILTEYLEVDFRVVLGVKVSGEKGDITVDWDFSENQPYDYDDASSLSYSYQGMQAGYKTVAVRVTDQEGNVAVDEKEIILNYSLEPGEPITPALPRLEEATAWDYTGKNPFVFDPSLAQNGLVVIVHGLIREDNPSYAKQLEWMALMGSAIKNRLKDNPPNILLYDWHENSNPSRATGLDEEIDARIQESYLIFSTDDALLGGNSINDSARKFIRDIWKIRDLAEEQGQFLANYVRNMIDQDWVLPSDQAPIQFIGHSAGGFVSLMAAKNLSNHKEDPYHISLITTLDSPFLKGSYMPDAETGSIAERYVTSHWGNYVRPKWILDITNNRYTDWVDGVLVPVWFEMHSLAIYKYIETITDFNQTNGFYLSPVAGYPYSAPQSFSSPVAAFSAFSPAESAGGASFIETITDVPLTDWATFGSVSETPGQFTLTELTNSGITKQTSLPTGVQTLSFDYQFTQAGDGDFLRVSYGNRVLHRLYDLEMARSSTINASISLAAYAESEDLLAITLVSQGATNADAVISNIQYSESNDPDGDEISTDDEIVLGTDPLKWDTDGDGLSDSEEATYGTLVLVADSDGDGMPDGLEVAAKTDPTDPNSVFAVSAPAKVNGNTEITWSSAPGMTYTIIRASELPFATYTVVDTNVTSAGSTTTYMDDDPPIPEPDILFYMVVGEEAE